MIVRFIGLVFNREITVEIYSIIFFMYPWFEIYVATASFGRKTVTLRFQLGKYFRIFQAKNDFTTRKCISIHSTNTSAPFLALNSSEVRGRPSSRLVLYTERDLE
jgi:hypothetical protein